MALLAMALAWVAHKGDLWIALLERDELPPVIYVSDGANARDVASTLLGSMMTMTSLVFSITMVVLTLAASQFGPRLIRNFMASPHTQVVLGTFVMTTIYCLLTLGTIGSRAANQQQAYLSVSLSIGLVLLSVGLLVFFLHFLARSIVSESVIERVGKEIGSLWDELDPVPHEQGQNWEAPVPDDYRTGAALFGPSRDGYVATIDFSHLVDLAERHDVLISIGFGPGEYVVEGGVGLGVYPASRCTDRTREQVQKAITVASQRTPAQDPEYSIRHLVEIGVRALSPGVSDPYTAVAVINQLSASLCRLMARALPSGQLHDQRGHLRVICQRPTYGTLVSAAYNQLRQNAGGAALVYIHLVEALHRIAEFSTLEAQREALRHQLGMVCAAAARNLPEAYDRQAVESRAQLALSKLNAISD
ncbi:DUF2254 domain-containing protein [Devosia salina]|uniref:DUF2254 domain-containing protein n=2 Tax=Devosia salina TaxID=2860336 RepID=A0ABX8W911_9HYPH|nr:DUF2254 domain-containing protein [Devosia salina]